MPYQLKRIVTLCLAGLLFLTVACDDGPPPEFTTQERELMDTLYLQRVSVLRPRLDSACEANFNSNVLRLADSLVKVRKAEEAALRERALGH
jgi:hypothetical protein